MQINWGNKLIIVYSTFVLGMGFMVYKCTQQKTEMVTADYYEKELKYQEVIDGIQNANNLGMAMKLEQQDATVMLTMPAEALGATGSVDFYRPSDASKDFTVSLGTNAGGMQLFDRAKFVTGLYKVKVNWEKEGRKFYAEQSLVIK